MASFVSKEGVWVPAKEHAVDPNAPIGQEIYDGPDRAATQMLKEAGVKHFGNHYSLDPELNMRARQLGFNSVDEYLKMFNYDKAKAEAHYQKAMDEVHAHKDQPRRPAQTFVGGGRDTSNSGKTRLGGFEHPDDAPSGMGKSADSGQLPQGPIIEPVGPTPAPTPDQARPDA